MNRHLFYSGNCFCANDNLNISSLDNSLNCAISSRPAGKKFAASMMGNSPTSFALHKRAPLMYESTAFPIVKPFFSNGCFPSKTGITMKATDVTAYKCAHLCNGAVGTFFGLQNG